MHTPVALMLAPGLFRHRAGMRGGALIG